LLSTTLTPFFGEVFANLLGEAAPA